MEAASAPGSKEAIVRNKLFTLSPVFAETSMNNVSSSLAKFSPSSVVTYLFLVIIILINLTFFLGHLLYYQLYIQ